MTNINTLSTALLCFFAFAIVQALEDKTICVIIDTPTTATPSESYKTQIIQETTQSINAITDATEAALANKKDDKEFEFALQRNVVAFVQACNKDASTKNRKIIYTIDKKDDTTMTIKITCKEEKPKTEYWESIKSSVSSAATAVVDKTKTAGNFVKEKAQSGAQVVSTKAQEAGTFVKEKAQVGATKVGDAAAVVKDKTKQSIHSAAEKVADLTK